MPQQDPLPVDGLLHCSTPFLGCTHAPRHYLLQQVLQSSRAGSRLGRSWGGYIFVGGETTAAAVGGVGKGNHGGFTTKLCGRRSPRRGGADSESPAPGGLRGVSGVFFFFLNCVSGAEVAEEKYRGCLVTRMKPYMHFGMQRGSVWLPA